eukprot:COSAG02_NODE_325_length_24616_cov_17.214667_14_plen_856_part_00
MNRPEVGYNSINIAQNPVFGNLDVPPLTILLIAPPGCLKYHYASVLAERYNLKHIDASELLVSSGQEFLQEKQEELRQMTVKELRLRAKEESINLSRVKHALAEDNPGGALTDLLMQHYRAMEGQEGQSSVKTGKMVADRYIARPLSRAIEEAARTGWVMTGFPRTEAQAHMLQGLHTSPSMIVVLEADAEECKRGCAARRVDTRVTPSEVYDLERRPPAHEKVKSRLKKRENDNPDIVNVRLGHFRANCHSVLNTFDPENEITFRIPTREHASETLGDIVELVEAVNQGLNTDSHTEYLIDLFTSADIDGSGQLNYSELYEAMQNVGVEVSKGTIKRIIEAADDDADGNLTQEEFLACFEADSGPEDVIDLVDSAMTGGRDHTGWRSFCDVISNSDVCKLNAAHIGMDDNATKRLADSLTDTLVELDITGNPFGAAGVEDLATAFTSKPNIVSLLGLEADTRSLDLTNVVMTPSSTALLATEIQDGRSLGAVTSIAVNSTGKSEDPQKLLLKHDTSILDVSDLNFGPSDALLVAAFLQANIAFNSNLRTLKAITTGDSSNPQPYTLRVEDKLIDLMDKSVGTQDAMLLTSWISMPLVRQNANAINLLGNPIEDKGLEAVFAMVDGSSIENLNPEAPIGTRIDSVCGIMRGQDDLDWSNRDLSVDDCRTMSADIKYSIEYGRFDVTNINLTGTLLPNEGKRLLAEILPEAALQTLTLQLGNRAVQLDMDSKHIGAEDTELGPVDAFLISKWMQADGPQNTLTSIDLSGCLISGSRNMVQSTINPRYEIDTDLSGLKELMPTLEMMPNMQVLNLANNKFGEQAAEYLLSSLNWDKTKLTVSRAVVTTRVTASIRSH